MTVKPWIFAIAAGALAVSGCTGPVSRNFDRDVFNPAKMHPVSVDQAVASVSFTHAPSETRLTSNDAVRLREFVAGYTRNGHGPISVTVEGASADDPTALRRSREFQAAIIGDGVPTSDVERYLAPTPRAESGRVITVVSYERYVVRVPECGNWSKVTTYNPKNEPHSNFGCASQSYRAMMAADPADLLRARPMGERDMFRLRDVFNKYRAGETTATKVPTTEQELLRVSTQ